MKMKYINIKIKAFIFALLTIGMLTGCDDDDSAPVATTPALMAKALITESTWNVSSVAVDELDFSATYPGLSLSFGDGTYTSTNGGAIFSESGTWFFASLDADAIILDNDLEVDILELTEASFVLGLTWTQNTIGTGGRTESISGQHVFTFTK